MIKLYIYIHVAIINRKENDNNDLIFNEYDKNYERRIRYLIKNNDILIHLIMIWCHNIRMIEIVN